MDFSFFAIVLDQSFDFAAVEAHDFVDVRIEGDVFGYVEAGGDVVEGDG